jgi:hypothetical protein
MSVSVQDADTTFAANRSCVVSLVAATTARKYGHDDQEVDALLR